MIRMLMGLSVAVACVALAACKPTQQAAAPSAPPPAVGVIAAEMKGVKPALSFIGRIKAVDTVQIRARVEGFLDKILFKEGQYVKAGDLLYQIEKTQYQAAVDQAKANVAAAEAEELNAQFQFNRAVRARQDPVRHSGDRRHDARRPRQRQGERAPEQGGRYHRRGEPQLYRYSSPIDGRIGLTAFTQGNLVNPASGVLATIVSEDPIYAEFPVSVRQLDDLAAAHKGKDIAGPFDIKAFLTLANGQPYDQPGDWNYVGNQVDPQTDTLLVRAVFPNPSINSSMGLMSPSKWKRPNSSRGW